MKGTNKIIMKTHKNITNQRPIIFNTEMVEAILEGRKTQTRRLKGLDDINKKSGDWIWKNKVKKNICRFWNGKIEDDPNPLKVFFILTNIISNKTIELKCPYGKPGDLLWVRERFETDTDGDVKFYAGNIEVKHNRAYGRLTKWKPSIHMPKVAARIWLEIINIRIEKLNDISRDDAKSEGIKIVNQTEFGPLYSNYLQDPIHYVYASPKNSFKSLWLKINGVDSLDADPWVWVVEFKRIEKPEHDK